MITVSMTEINNQLPQFLQFVRNGEKVRIVDEGQIIADIVSPDNDSPKNTVEEKFKQLIKAGRMMPAKTNKLLKMPKITEKEKSINWEKIYNETRADRF
jgi:antitoxin (DNA-binding transcriptional repressor) of toxin-antitoxin stability system